MEQTIIKDILESDASFRASFDPKSENFHGGDVTPVPVGGNRVPKGMTEENLKEEVQTTPTEKPYFGEEYEKTERIRTDLGNLKTFLTNILVPFDAIAQMKWGKVDEAKLKTLQTNLDNMLVQLQDWKKTFPKGSEFSKEEILDDVTSKMKNTDLNKDQLFDVGALIKKHTSQIFREQKTLLDRMKQLKKTAATK